MKTLAKDYQDEDWETPPLLREEEEESEEEPWETESDEGIKGKIKGLDRTFDRWMSKYSETADRSLDMIEEQRPALQKRAKGVMVTAMERKKRMDERGEMTFSKLRSVKFSSVLMDWVIKRSKIVVIVSLIIALLIGGLGAPAIQENIRGDLEVYLPTGDKVSEDLDDVRQHWSTDIIVIYCETNNARDRDDITNMSDVSVLKEMDYIEESLNTHKADQGKKDGVVFTLSLSVLVKEINSTPNNMRNATEEEVGFPLPNLGYLHGDYSIPEQSRVDDIVEQLPPETIGAIAKDTNGDGIMDSGGIMIGLHKDVDQAKILKRIQGLMDDKGLDPEINKDWSEDYSNGKVHQRMWITGPVPMIHAITERTYEETIVILPIAFILLCLVLIYFHRTLKILVVIWLPVLGSLAMTFGILGILNMTLTPQVVFVAPVLLALGLAYGLYIANRYSEESEIEDRAERIRAAVSHTSRPIFLSAITTSFGFGALMTAQMLPLQVLGFALALGILICYTLTMLMTPSLVMWLDYKEAGTGAWKRAGDIPINNRKKILFVIVTFVMISLVWGVPQMKANMDLIAMSPQDETTITKMDEYGRKFGSGQIGMVMVEGRRGPMSMNQPSDSLRDFDVLKDIDIVNANINAVEYTNSLSIVDIMKSISVNVTVPVPVAGDIPFQGSFWEIISNPRYENMYVRGKSVQQIFIDVFYNSISDEMKSMIIADEYSKTLIYVFQPTLDTAKTEELVNEINSLIKGNAWTQGETSSDFTGTGAIMVRVNNLLLLNSYQSLAVAMVLVFIILWIVFRSLKFASITMVPIAMVVALEPLTLLMVPRIDPISYEFMAWGIDLNLFTAIIASVIVGLGIDFSIHITERVRDGRATLDSIRKSVNTSGRSFTEAVITMIVGLSTIFIIPIQSMWEFVELIIILLVFSVVGALLVLPSLYAFVVKDMEKSDSLRKDLDRKQGVMSKIIKKTRRFMQEEDTEQVEGK